MSLPSYNTKIQEFSLMQSGWASQIDPMLDNPSLKTSLLKNISLVSGNNVINHLLSRTQQGWRIVDINAAVSIYRSAPFNASTLTLNSSGSAVISLEVF